MEEQTNRRNFLKYGAGGVAGILSLAKVSEAIAQSCAVVATPPQTSGPFYPGERQFGLDTDLTTVPGRPVRAQGKVVYIRGRVVDHQCRPVVGANVEIWQACASGRYNSPKDPNPAPLDPNFKYWAETFTDAKGEYIFKTIIPGAYPADNAWDRPPHIHFKISKLGFRELITQMYFAGEALNDADLILQQLPSLERESVIVDFKPSPAGMEPDSQMGFFEISLLPVRS